VTRRAAIAVTPSFVAEALGLSALEAHAAGAALISSGRGGLREASGAHAVYVDPPVAPDLTRAMTALVENAGQRIAMARAGQAFVAAVHAPAVRSAQLDDLRETLVAERAQVRPPRLGSGLAAPSRLRSPCVRGPFSPPAEARRGSGLDLVRPGPSPLESGAATPAVWRPPWAPEPSSPACSSARRPSPVARPRAKRILQLPDRRLLAEAYLPALAAGGGRILWVGCRAYTADDYAVLEAGGAEVWTTDIDPEAARWGVQGRHRTGDVCVIDQVFGDMTFDAISCNGVWAMASTRRSSSVRRWWPWPISCGPAGGCCWAGTPTRSRIPVAAGLTVAGVHADALCGAGEPGALRRGDPRL
jgi:hypothetical protein